MQRSLISIVVVGVVCGIIGVYIILKGLSFLGAGIAHSCFAGGTLAILLGTNPFLTIFLTGEFSAGIIAYLNEKGSSGEKDTAVGIMFSFAMALAILFAALNNKYTTNIQSLLFGNALLITTESFYELLIIAFLILIIFFGIKKELMFVTYDEEMAKVMGIPVRVLNYIFLALVAGIITVSLKAIGALLVFAMIVTPAAAAYQWTYKSNWMIVLSGLFGCISAVFGIIISFLYDIPTGPSVVLCVTLIFAVSFIISPKRRGFKFVSIQDQPEHRKECIYCREDENEHCPFCDEESEFENEHKFELQFSSD
ncbi:MAG: metal ABC transporter permease [Promethearchaeota archaeon]